MIDQLAMPFEKRAENASNPAAKRLFYLMAEKKTNLALADDETDSKKFLKLADDIGPEIALLKTHIDIIKDFTPSVTQELVRLAQKHNFMIFEDRKFADIGNTVKLQYTEGIYKIVEWANFVNLHVVPGPGIIKAVAEAIRETREKGDNKERGIIILAQMSSEGTLATGEYTKAAVAMANQFKEAVSGYISAGSVPEKLRELVSMSDAGHVIFAPGVQFVAKADALGQQYATPEQSVSAGADCIIVGRGIHGAENPLQAAKDYRKAGWDAYLKRVSKGLAKSINK